MKKLSYLGFLLFAFMFILCNPSALSLSSFVIDEASDIPEHLFTWLSTGDVTCTSDTPEIFTLDADKKITVVADGIGLYHCTYDISTEYDVIIVNLNGTYTNSISAKETALARVTSFNVNFPKEFMSITVDFYGSDYQYGLDALGFALYDFLNTDSNVKFFPSEMEANEALTNVTFKLGRSLYYSIEQGDSPHSGDHSWTSDNSKVLDINYKPFVAEDAAKVETAKSKVRETYYVNIEDIYEELFEDIDDINEWLANHSDLQKDLGTDIFYEIDARRGDCSPQDPSFAGYIKLGTNETVYDVTNEIMFRKAIVIPTIKAGENITEVVKKYFEDNIIGSDEKVEIEAVEPMSPDGETYYEATITPKTAVPVIPFLTKLLLPKLNAYENEKVVAFQVVQSDAVVSNANANANPKTNDNINLYIGLALMTTITIGLGYSVLKKNN